MAIEAGVDAVDSGGSGVGPAARRWWPARLATGAAQDPAGADQPAHARHTGVGGTSAATAAGAGARQRGATTITVGATATWGRSRAHDTARTGGASPPARAAANLAQLTSAIRFGVRAGASR